MPSAASDERLVAMLADRARSEGLQPTREGGLLQQLTKRVPEPALEGEITDHLGYDKHDPAGTGPATAPPAVGSDVTAHPTATTTDPANLCGHSSRC